MLDYLAGQGVPDKASSPYQDRNLPCRRTCADWAMRATHIGAWHQILDANSRKQWLSHIGPLVEAMNNARWN